MFSQRFVVVPIVALLMAASPGVARAAVVPYADTVLVTGTQIDVVALDIGQPGGFEVRITDLALPVSPLSALSVRVFQSSTLLAESDDRIGGSLTLGFFLTATGQVSVEVYARALMQESLRMYGMYSINVVSTAPVVALPASLYLLLSGIGLAFPVLRRRIAAPREAFAAQPA